MILKRKRGMFNNIVIKRSPLRLCQCGEDASVKGYLS